MLYRASLCAAILVAGARAGEGEVCMDDDTSGMQETQAESSALQVKLEVDQDGKKLPKPCEGKVGWWCTDGTLYKSCCKGTKPCEITKLSSGNHCGFGGGYGGNEQ